MRQFALNVILHGAFRPDLYVTLVEVVHVENCPNVRLKKFYAISCLLLSKLA